VITPDLRSALARLPRLGLCILVLLPAFTSPDSLRAAQKSKDKDKEKPYAVIVGTVWGPDDHPIYGIPVLIRRAKDKKPKWQVYSDHHGEFAQRLPAGESDYILTADLKHVKTADGKALHLAREVSVHVYGEEREDVGLHLTY
jgi:uncharacterized protein YegP (UPF0339 family)